MLRTSKAFFQIVSTLAVVALITSAALPARAENPGVTLAWLNSTVTVPSRITAAPDDKVLTALKGNVYGLASAQFDKGMVDDNLSMEHIILLLQRSPEQEQMLTAVIDGLKNRRSPLYRHWLNPAQFGNHFGPSDADISVVTTWLQSHGFKIDQVTPGKTAIILSGSAGQVRTAFHTEIHNLSVNGEKHIANLTEPSIPVALAPVVLGFRSLNDFFPKPMVKNGGSFHRDKSSGRIQRAAGSHPLPQFTDTSDGYYLVGPQDFYTIYNENPVLASGVNGAGVNIAVVEETDINPADVTTFRTAFALPPYPSSPNSTQGGVNYLFGANGFCTDPGILTDGEEAEADIDTQWAGTAAPNAIIDFVSCASTSTSAGIDLSAMYIVNDLAPGVATSPVSAFSESYGACELLAGSAEAAFYTGMWEQAAAQGQTVVVASGDSGSMGCPGTEDASGDIYSTSDVSVNVLASSIYNIAAGGTDFSDTYQTYSFATGTCCATWWNQTQSTNANGYESALSYVPEITWGGYCSSNVYASFAQANAYGIGATPLAICNYFYNNEPGSGYIDLIGGGGGVSQFNNIPTWQAVYGVGLANSSTAFRNMPDISMFASSGFWGHNLPFCESDLTACDFDGSFEFGNFSAAGGTSFVAPEMAGVMALVVQFTTANQGPANYNLYGLAAQEYGVPGGTFSGAACSGSGLGAGVGGTCLFQDIAGDTPCVAGGTTSCNAGGATLTSQIDEPCLWNSTYTNCYHRTAAQTIGISSVSNATNSSAYSVGQGFDVATGLGSLNISNLVSQWNTLTTLWPTSTTLAANPTTLNGGSTTLTAQVSTTGRGGFVAPVGSVTFTNTTTAATLGTGLLSSTCTGTPPNYSCSPGTATLVASSDLFQLGANNVVANFPGDGANDAPSMSAPVLVTVNQLATTTTVTSSLNPSVYGQAVTFTASITPVSTPGPTGTVEFQANGVDIVGCSAVAVASAAAQCVSGGRTACRSGRMPS
ncbi:MAG: protease pro-enzyme activation domain-containing protein [Terriglobales bacterium]